MFDNLPTHQLPNGKVQISLNPTARYNVVKIINEQRQVLLMSNLLFDDACAAIVAIYDNETPMPNIRYMLEQE